MENIYQFCDRHQFIVHESFWAVGFIENDFNSMLILGLSFLRVVGAYKVYSEFVPWEFFWNYHSLYLALYIDLIIYWLPYRMALYFLTMNHARIVQLLVMHQLFQIKYKKEINMHVLCS